MEASVSRRDASNLVFASAAKQSMRRCGAWIASLRSQRRDWLRDQSGFTLIEIMVALAVFGLAALALLRLQGTSARSTADIERRALGQIVANNIAVEAMTDPAPPSLGTSSGAETNGGLQWRWTRTVARTADIRIVRIDVGVIGPDGRNGGALSVARRVQP
jgi:general secretion pathway protein I